MRVLVTVASRHGATWEIGEVIAEVLADRGLDVETRAPEDVSTLDGVDAVVLGSAVYLAEHTNAVGIVSMTVSGYTAFEISSHRPKAGTYIFTSNKNLLKALSLVWGVRAFYYDKLESTDRTIADVNEILKSENLIEVGDVVINTASVPITKQGKTNMLKVSVVV